MVCSRSLLDYPDQNTSSSLGKQEEDPIAAGNYWRGPRWLAILVLGRDVLLLIGSAIAYNFTKLRKFPPSVWGKLTTLLQIVSAIAWMAHNAWPAPVLGTVAEGLLWPTAVATVGSGAHYIWRGWRTMRPFV